LPPLYFNVLKNSPSWQGSFSYRLYSDPTDYPNTPNLKCPVPEVIPKFKERGIKGVRLITISSGFYWTYNQKRSKIKSTGREYALND